MYRSQESLYYCSIAVYIILITTPAHSIPRGTTIRTIIVGYITLLHRYTVQYIRYSRQLCKVEAKRGGGERGARESKYCVLPLCLTLSPRCRCRLPSPLVHCAHSRDAAVSFSTEFHSMAALYTSTFLPPPSFLPPGITAQSAAGGFILSYCAVHTILRYLGNQVMTCTVLLDSMVN